MCLEVSSKPQRLAPLCKTVRLCLQFRPKIPASIPTSVWVEQNGANGFRNSEALYRWKAVLFFLLLLFPLSWTAQPRIFV